MTEIFPASKILAEYTWLDSNYLLVEMRSTDKMPDHLCMKYFMNSWFDRVFSSKEVREKNTMERAMKWVNEQVTLLHE